MKPEVSKIRQNDIRQVLTLPGETLEGLAARHLGDPSRFRVIADLNNLNPITGVSPEQILEVPFREALSKAEPVFSQMQEGLNQFQGRFSSIIDRAQQVVGVASQFLPEGYTQAAMDALAEANDVLGDVQSVIPQAQQQLQNQLYQGRARLVDWLLN